MDKNIANTVYSRCKEVPSIFKSLSIVETIIENEVPRLKFLFFADENDLTVEVVSINDDFQAQWSDAPCVIVDAYTFKEAKQILKEAYNLDENNISAWWDYWDAINGGVYR
jgi:hypothetical protein